MSNKENNDDIMKEIEENFKKKIEMEKFLYGDEMGIKLEDSIFDMDDEDLVKEKKEVKTEKKKVKKEKKNKNKDRKKFKDMTNKEKVFFILSAIKNIIGKIVRFFLKFFFVLFILLFMCGCIVGGYIFSQVWPYVEEYKEVAYEKFNDIDPNTFTYLSDTVIYDKNNNVISELNVNNYEYIKIDEVSKWVSEGYIAVEDKRFKVHNGIDYKALARASLSIVKNRGKITQGGSTITQQVLKNGLLTQERTLKRKLIEFFLAPEFEKNYSKTQIMEFYINTNFYGNNCYGIETASLYYFGKNSKDLDIAEAAMLVGVSNNGSYYNPRKNFEAVKERQEFVLGEMLEEGYITKEEYQTAKNEELNLVYHREQREKEDYLTSYAIHCAILSMMEKEGFEFKYLFDNEKDYSDYKDRYSDLYMELGSEIRQGGYQIYTSLDVEKQNKLQNIIDDALSKYTEVAEDGRFTFQGASVVVNNETGYVEAIVGGRGTEDEFNRGFLAKRQPGSSIKPLVVYTPAFNTGLYYPSLVMNDKDDPSDKYYPKNYNSSFMGRVSIREALGRSINTIAYQIMRDIGPEYCIDYLTKMKFDTLAYEDFNNMAVSLGGFTFGVRVVDMAKGYSTLINQGTYIDNTCIKKIEYQNEGIVFEEDSEKIPVFEPDAAYLTVDCCRGVLEESYGTGKGRKIKNQVGMAKTGTTNDSKDVWFCGGTEYYSMAVWVGYDTPKDTHLTGSSIPGSIWNTMMTEIHQDLEEKEFEKPESIVELSIDYEGKISKYNTGRVGLFSQTILDKLDEDRLNTVENKRLNLDNLRIEKIEKDLSELCSFNVSDISNATNLLNKLSNINNRIEEVYQEDKKVQLLEKLENIYNYLSDDIDRMNRYVQRQEVLKVVQDRVNLEKNIINSLNDLNNYTISNISDVKYVDNKYSEIQEMIGKLNNSDKEMYYLNHLNSIKSNKDVLLESYREELLQQQEIEKEEIISELELSLGYLKELNTYYNGVEYIFNSFEKQINEAEEQNIDVTYYREELERIKFFIYSLNNSGLENNNFDNEDENSEFVEDNNSGENNNLQENNDLDNVINNENIIN